MLNDSGINLSKLSSRKLTELLLINKKIQIKKKSRKLPGPQDFVNVRAWNKVDINKITGGKLSVSLPNLPQVVMVNQNPYYSYNPKSMDR